MYRVSGYKHFLICLCNRKPGRKTDIYDIVNRRSEIKIGTIKWYAPWRQYCFFPDDGSVWNAGCLADVNSFLAELKEERKRDGH